VNRRRGARFRRSRSGASAVEVVAVAPEPRSAIEASRRTDAKLAATLERRKHRRDYSALLALARRPLFDAPPATFAPRIELPNGPMPDGVSAKQLADEVLRRKRERDPLGLEERAPVPPPPSADGLDRPDLPATGDGPFDAPRRTQSRRAAPADVITAAGRAAARSAVEELKALYPLPQHLRVR
jgi:hypothetical protein